MRMTNGRDLNWRWVAAACVAALVIPGLAQAGHDKRPDRRSLAPGSLARAGAAARPGATPADPTVAAAVDRLRRAADAAVASADAPASPVRLVLGAGGFVRSMSLPVALAPAPGAGRDAGRAALSFLHENRAALGWSKDGVSLPTRSVRRSQGRSYVRFEQRFQGLRVFGAGAVVQVDPSGGVRFVLADLARDDAAFHSVGFEIHPTGDAAEGLRAARDLVLKARGSADTIAEPAELMLYEPSVIGEAGPSRLVWHVRVRNADGDVNEVVLVDARSGDVAFHYSDVKHAKSRNVYDHANVAGSAGNLVRTEGSPASGIAEADLAYQYFGDTYDFYFSRFGRDSYNGTGGALVGRVRYCDPASPCPYQNAYWNGSEMRFGDGFAAADDVAAHELTHGVTEFESNLIYWGESGAINEALSDIFGEFVDLTNAGGDDSPGVRWLMGEDVPGGAIRSMSDPASFGDPDRRFSVLWYSGSEDNRGVHFNSGVANKLAFLLTDGASFNGQTVSPLGVDAVAALFYEAQANLLVPASDYYDLDAALVQAAANLAWSTANRDNLERARRAVEIAGAPNPVNLFEDGFESTVGNWQVFDLGGASGTGSGTTWGLSSHRKASGSYSLYCAAGGPSPAVPGTSYKPLMDTWVVYGPFSLAQAQAAWIEFDMYLDIEYPFDDIFWGVSLDGELFDGYAVSPGPEGLTPGWVHEVFNLQEVQSSTPAIGQGQVWFAFNFASDDIVEWEGAYVDNLAIRQSYGPTTSTLVNRYRLYSDITKEHHYTTDLNEYTVLGTRGWLQEGVAHKAYTTNAPAHGLVPVPLYRLYHAGILQHLWTTDANEYSVLGTRGWTQEGIDGYILPSSVPGVTVPLYRLAYLFLPIHLWTTDLNEYTVLATRGWVQEGVVGHVVP